MAQAPMISVPLKATNEIDWVTPLKTYIRDTYGDDPDRYADECATLNRLRQDIRGAGKDTTSGRDMLYRYYGQLELLDLRFPVDEQHIKVSFTWFDAFTHKSTSQYSLAFEKASIIFNIAAVLSCHGALQSRSVESQLKMAYHSFQASAGMFTYINENFLHAPSSDLSRLSVKTMIGLMLAQAQEIFLERQVTDQKKVGLLAKLASQAAYLYGQALEGIQENVAKGVFEKPWQLLVQIKSNHMAAVSQYYQGLADDDANNYGIAIARLNVAENLAKEAQRNAAAFPSSPSPTSNLSSETGSVMVDVTRRQLALIQEKLRVLNRDNDYLYHVPVPDEATLSPIPKMPAAKPIPVSELYTGEDIQRITGPDLFSKIIPLAVTEAASLYDEEKAKLIRAESERVDRADSEYAASLDYLRLPAALQVLQGSLEDQDAGPDDEFRAWCDHVAAAAAAAHDSPVAVLDSLAADKGVIKAILDKCSRQLDTEESVCEKMRSKHDKDWTQQPSARLTSTLRGDIRNYRDALDEGAKTDSQLLAKHKQSQVELDEMRQAAERGGVDDLFQRAVAKLRSKTNPQGQEPSLLDADFDDDDGPGVMEQIARVKEVLKKLNLLRKERRQVLADLKEKVHQDDISQILILNKKSIANIEQKLFQQELEKFRPHQNRLLQAIHKQSHLMKELSTTYNALLQDKKVQAEKAKHDALQRHHAAIANRYKRAYQDFLDLEAGLASARKWYAEMLETVQSLEKNVETFVNNRRAEGAQLLDQIEQERQLNKNAQAELERERLRDLMDRMSMEPLTTPPSSSITTTTTTTAAQPSPNPKPPRPDPIFTPSASTRYPPTNFQGQYQVAAPPNSQQQQHAQHTYNPSHFGRNPGPTSPPPNQTSFSRSASVASSGPRNYGAASPPPTQTAFARDHHQSFPGYAVPQQQQMNRPVSVPSQNQQQQQQQQQQHQQQHQQHQQPQQQQPPLPPPVPSSFVLPPPPMGPPPLGPQQTIHYNSQDYPYDTRLSAENVAKIDSRPAPPPSQPQAPLNHDPWAGLNAWK